MSEFQFQSPMLCGSLKEKYIPTTSMEGYAIEPKYDGARALLYKSSNGGVKVFSRSGREFTEHVPHIVDAMKSSSIPGGIVLDGELGLVKKQVFVEKRDVPLLDFNKSLRILGSLAERGRRLQEEEFGYLSFLTYDLLRWDEEDITQSVYGDRRHALMQLESTLPQSVRITPAWMMADNDLLSSVYYGIIREGGEGVILKNRAKPYLFGKRPAKNQLKIKATTEADVVITGYKPGTGKYEGLVGSVNFGRWTPDGIVYVGRCSGMTDKERQFFSENREGLVGRVITVSFNELVGSREYRSPRHPQFLRLREPADKSAEECDGREFRVEEGS